MEPCNFISDTTCLAHGRHPIFCAKDLQAENAKLCAALEKAEAAEDLRNMCSDLDAQLRAANLQKDELLKAADALLGKMGGPHSPVQPVYEDEFVTLELLVDKLNGNDVESIEKRQTQ